jgi:hypothetical protein
MKGSSNATQIHTYSLPVAKVICGTKSRSIYVSLSPVEVALFNIYIYTLYIVEGTITFGTNQKGGVNGTLTFEEFENEK